jgi:hypothetical protein
VRSAPAAAAIRAEHGARSSEFAVSTTHAPDLDEQLQRLVKRLPRRLARMVDWLRRPGSRRYRVPAAIILILFGLVGFLPIVGLWMIPLGLILIAEDVPALRPPLARFIAWIERKLARRAQHEQHK